MQPLALSTVTQAIVTDEQNVKLFLSEFPQKISIGCMVDNISRYPDFTATGCCCRNNRARGFLISTCGKVRIERNYFQVGGAAVKISGDTHTWFESGPVTDVLIVRNTFDNCLIGPWGRAIIDIDPEIQAIDPNGLCYHQNITIEGNCFISFQERMVYAFSVDGLMFRNNRVEKAFYLLLLLTATA